LEQQGLHHLLSLSDINTLTILCFLFMSEDNTLQLKKLASPKKEERDVDGRLMPQGSVLLTQCHWDNTCPLQILVPASLM
jgi:hypothetical protein